MLYTLLTKKAIALMFEVHKDQKDKGGLPYVFHPFHLAEQMHDENSVLCALLHDVVEDSDYTLNDIQEMGYPAEVVSALRLLTHEDGVDYMDYIQKIAKNPLAKRIKIADLRHNTDLSRLDLREDDPTLQKILKKQELYHKALAYLLEIPLPEVRLYGELFRAPKMRIGSAYYEFQYCKAFLPTETLLTPDYYNRHFEEDSLLVHSDDDEIFFSAYLPYLKDTTTPNGEHLFDSCGVNYYTKDQAKQILNKIQEKKPLEFDVLRSWLTKAISEYNGFYILGL